MQRQQRPIVRSVHHAHVIVEAQAFEVPGYRLPIRRVANHEVILSVLFVQINIVDKSAALIGQHRILPASVLEFGGVVQGDKAQKLGCARAQNAQLTHVAHVKKPYVSTHFYVLFGDARVLQWHRPTRKIHHLSSELEVAFVKGCFHSLEINTLLRCAFLRQIQD